MPATSLGGTAASPARSCRTGSTSIWGTWRRPSSTRRRLYTRAAAGEDIGEALRANARQADRDSASARWACYRDFGRSRVLVVDSRAARVLADGRRDMVDDGEWEWIRVHSRGDFDHLIIVSSMPVFLSPGVHYLEAWSEAVCSGAWGGTAAGSARRCGGRSTSSTGRRSSGRSSG